MQETRQNMQDLVSWNLWEDFQSKIKENNKNNVLIASNLTRLEIETGRYMYVKNIVFVTPFFFFFLHQKQLRMFLTLSHI